MSATVSPVPQPIALQLDVAIVFEALILKRLGHLPKSRKQAWLRGLLVQGFRNECRALRDLQRVDPSDANTPWQQNMARNQAAVEHRDPRPQQETYLATKSVAVSERPAGNTVSFAALRKVIG